MNNLTEEQQQLLKFTTLQSGQNAWDFVQSFSDADKVWIAAGILSCVDHCYGLDRLTINWESRELRYAGIADCARPCEKHQPSVPSHHQREPVDGSDDIAPYLEGLPSGAPVNLRKAIQEESARLISIAKEVGQFIPASEWDTFGVRTKKLSGESIVYYDEPNSRVVKFKDPFAYIALKGDNPYTVLYEHHVHNHFFGDAGYHLLGVSQDPVSGGARLVFEQLFIDTLERPSRAAIHQWFSSRRFRLTSDGFWYTDGRVSFTDVWADNCLKDPDGNLHFIDPCIVSKRV